MGLENLSTRNGIQLFIGPFLILLTVFIPFPIKTDEELCGKERFQNDNSTIVSCRVHQLSNDRSQTFMVGGRNGHGEWRRCHGKWTRRFRRRFKNKRRTVPLLILLPHRDLTMTIS